MFRVAYCNFHAINMCLYVQYDRFMEVSKNRFYKCPLETCLYSIFHKAPFTLSGTATDWPTGVDSLTSDGIYHMDTCTKTFTDVESHRNK